MRPPGELAAGAPVAAIGTSQGLPLKIDGGGVVVAARPAELDFFTATLDAFHNGSGSGVYDADGRLAGILARGESRLRRQG